MDNIDELFASNPMEHLVKILQNASPQAITNALDVLFEEYSILNLAIEEQLKYDAKKIKNIYEKDILISKNDLVIRLMTDILSQE